MDLQTFVRETLVEIVAGISEAQKVVTYNQAKIVPKIAYERDSSKHLPGLPVGPSQEIAAAAGLMLTAQGEVAEMIEFDIALTVSEATSESSETEGGGKAGAKLQIASLEIGGSRTSKKQSDKSGSSVSRIKFRIPVVFPHRH